MEEKPAWPELLGSNNWENLLDPLDLNLRKRILRCGDLCQATYDAFNNDQNSKYCGASRYGKKNFFKKVMLESPPEDYYQVSAFLYATARVTVPEAFILHSQSRESWDRESNWIGYIAVTSDVATKALGRREIYVVWRGTTRNYEWVNVLYADLESASPLLSSSSQNETGNDEEKVMRGWLTIYISNDLNSPFAKLNARTQLLNKIKHLRERYQGEELSIIFTGHSLGASLAVLSAFDAVENVVKDILVTAIIFGSPQVGNKAFNDRLNKHENLKILHVKNTIDLIPHYPGSLLGYADTGTELVIDSRKSPSLKQSNTPGDWHNLQGMLHVVAGWNGVQGEFELKVKRSLALVNKSSQFLKDEYLIPGSWWVEKNRGMVRDKDAEWVLIPEAEEDLPVPEY
uniref:Phospholipase A1 n=1 Tax=Rhizophora mucronata TaxID=61149 RepID=A0A2P2PIX3_RHIMU